ncbi:carbohydrate ABC transporter permease [Geobacillus sp. WSUCF-018B]|uniref:Sugar abc transporter, permease protein n=1 Tax=Geobacillus stearothermophilus TaxID=1422 RepID=B3EYN0_GEOSE|nr:sugar ABC transporter permease [Geobacillus sp. WSUCF-018B]ACE73678.1 sugar abc transporter, permease protein [Geobacillus stearothermophilus]PJW18347.1 sugar ABC transporter permease [Geobacillus sp. WSUCF-018B]RXS90469.1 sugar ABC transporter permease [Geobacillus sp. PK12]TLS34733.1 sugar ABC transporter permease [Geobacillus thermoleovorans]
MILKEGRGVKRRRSHQSSLYRKEKIYAYLFISAPVIGFLVFTFVPSIYSLYGAFTDWNGLGQMNFIGLDNFKALFKDEYFYKAMYNTIFMMIGIPIGVVLSLLLALALNRGVPGTNVFRVIYYIPVISSIAAISILWQWAYNGDYGLVNQFLGFFGIKGPNWLQNVHTVKPALIIMAVWKGLGYTMLLYLAALQSVPKTFYEAAKLDGANALQSFWYITLPMVKPVTFFIIVTSVIGGAQIFTEIDVMTPNGGPEFSSASIVWYIWQKAFGNFQLGYASAMAVILGIFIFIVTYIQFRLNERSRFDMD